MRRASVAGKPGREEIDSRICPEQGSGFPGQDLRCREGKEGERGRIGRVRAQELVQGSARQSTGERGVDFRNAERDGVVRSGPSLDPADSVAKCKKGNIGTHIEQNMNKKRVSCKLRAMEAESTNGEWRARTCCLPQQGQWQRPGDRTEIDPVHASSGHAVLHRSRYRIGPATLRRLQALSSIRATRKPRYLSRGADFPVSENSCCRLRQPRGRTSLKDISASFASVILWSEQMGPLEARRRLT